MSEVKFSRGPWECESTRDRKRICIGVGMFEVNGIYIAEVDTDDITESERDTAKANAHLIAAAPDLYEALECLIRITDDGFSLTPISVAIQLSRSALAKARGETP